MKEKQPERATPCGAEERGRFRNKATFLQVASVGHGR